MEQLGALARGRFEPAECDGVTIVDGVGRRGPVALTLKALALSWRAATCPSLAL